MKKRSYNPFKMVGAWFGLVLANFLYPLVDFGVNSTIIDIFKDMTFLSILISSSIGFLIGWGIHSLIRRLKR